MVKETKGSRGGLLENGRVIELRMVVRHLESLLDAGMSLKRSSGSWQGLLAVAKSSSGPQLEDRIQWTRARDATSLPAVHRTASSSSVLSQLSVENPGIEPSRPCSICTDSDLIRTGSLPGESDDVRGESRLDFSPAEVPEIYGVTEI